VVAEHSIQHRGSSTDVTHPVVQGEVRRVPERLTRSTPLNTFNAIPLAPEGQSKTMARIRQTFDQYVLDVIDQFSKIGGIRRERASVYAGTSGDLIKIGFNEGYSPHAMAVQLRSIYIGERS